MSTSSRYLVNANTTAAINNGATQGWIQLMRAPGSSIGFQINLPATGSPIGAFIFEMTDDDNPLVPQGVILGAALIPLAAPYSGAVYQPTDGAARLVNFDFGPGQVVACPSAQWMRMRYAPVSGGAAALNVGVSQKGAF